jgi:hypothetical protein
MRKKYNSFSEMVADAIAGAIKATAEFIRKEAEENRRLSEYVGEGAHDPGAIVYRPGRDRTIVVEKYSAGEAIDTLNNTFIRGSGTGGVYGYPRTWVIHEKSGNYDVLLIVHGILSRGYRPIIGPTPAFTVTFAHRDSYFPHKDATYPTDFPLDRFAVMLNAAKGGGVSYADIGQRVIIDNREAHRAENERLAALESPDEIRTRNQIYNPARHPRAASFLPVPDTGIAFDPERKQTSSSDGSFFSAERAGDRDYYYWAGTWHDGKTGRDAQMTIHVRSAWRPGYGETYMLNVNRMYEGLDRHPQRTAKAVTEDDFPIARLVPLLNAYQPFTWRNEHLGHSVIVDTRANPIGYYYG